MPAGREFDVRGLRTRIGMTQAQFAQEIGVQAATVARWEQGVMKPSPMAIKQLEALERRAGRGKEAA